MNFKAIFLSILVLTLILVIPTFAWLNDSETVIVKVDNGTMKASLTKKDNALDSYVTSNYVTYNAVTRFSNNSYELIDTRINVNVESNINCYIRIKILDEWIMTRNYPSFNRTDTEVINHEASNFFPFHLDENWYYNENDRYCYYKIVIKDNTNDITFITGCDSYVPRTSQVFQETCILHLAFRIEMIQENRIDSVWGANLFDKTGGMS